MARYAQVATAPRVARVIGIAAAVLIVTTGAVSSGFSLLAVPFILYALAPYGLLYLIGRTASNPWIIGGAGVAALTVEAGVRAAVMLFPRGSTAGIALVFSPVLVGVIAMPAGAAAGAVLGWVFARRAPVLQAIGVLSAAAAIALTFISFARPELFPTTVAARRRHLEAIGPPRIAAGGDRFTRITVSEVSGWHVTGDFDGQPGEELAVVTHQGAQLIDGLTLEPMRFVEFGGVPGRLWSWYSRLARLGDTLVVVQTGGGFQDTDVRSLANQVIWRYRPDPQLAPSALLPGDLDRDGDVEFYASTTTALTRLNAKGEPVWSRPATLPQLLALDPGGGGEPGWVVSTRYDVGIDVLSPAGEPLAVVKWPGPVYGVVAWPDARCFLVGGDGVKGVDASGTTRFEIALDEPLMLTQGMAWTRQAAPPLLAVVAGGDRDLQRWRLRLYETPQSVVYDEVFDTPPRLLSLTHADGTSTLFVVVGNTLSVIRAAAPATAPKQAEADSGPASGVS